MDRWTLVIFFLVLAPLYGGAWPSSSEERRQNRELRRGGVHYHAKRHMLPNEPEAKKRPASPVRARENRKKMNQKVKPSGHLTPLKEDDIDNDEVVSVAIGPPPMRPMYDKMNWKHGPKNYQNNTQSNNGNGLNWTQGATNMVKDVLTQLGREFVTHQVNEDFVFGQYVGNAMRNLTSELKLNMQHEILELVIKYQKLSRGEVVTTAKPESEKNPITFLKENRMKISNDTNEEWPDFSNLAKIVG